MGKNLNEKYGFVDDLISILYPEYTLKNSKKNIEKWAEIYYEKVPSKAHRFTFKICNKNLFLSSTINKNVLRRKL